MKQNNIAGMFTVFIGRARANGFVQQQYLNLLANPVFGLKHKAAVEAACQDTYQNGLISLVRVL